MKCVEAIFCTTISGALIYPLVAVFFTFFYFTYVDNLEELKPYTSNEFNVNTSFTVYFWVLIIIATILFFKSLNDDYYEDDEGHFYTKISLFLLIVFIAINVALVVWTSKSVHPSEEFKTDLSNSVLYYEQDIWPLDIEMFQRKMNCCGIDSVFDYLETENAKRLNYKIPLSCCYKKDYNYTCTKFLAWRRGCYDAYDEKTYYFRLAVYVASGYSILMLSAFFFILLFYYLREYVVIVDKDKIFKENQSNRTDVYCKAAYK